MTSKQEKEILAQQQRQKALAHLQTVGQSVYVPGKPPPAHIIRRMRRPSTRKIVEIIL